MADISQFEQMILALCSPDNTIRNQAEQALNQAKENPEILLTAMTQLLRTNQNPQVRSMCALLLRKQAMQPGAADASGQASSSLARLSPQARQMVKSELLACIEAETERSIRKKVCDAVGQFGVSELSANIASWPELHVGETPSAPLAICAARTTASARAVPTRPPRAGPPPWGPRWWVRGLRPAWPRPGRRLGRAPPSPLQPPTRGKA